MSVTVSTAAAVQAGQAPAGSVGVVSAPHHDATTPADLDRVERDLAGVEVALARLDEGTYWTDEVTGQPLSDELLAADPVARSQREGDS
jgi:hypothetical protein